MTKNIALVVNELTADYTQEIITSISDFYRGKNVNFIVSQVKLPFQKGTDFDYQYWSNMSLLDNDNIDAYIVLSAIFCSYMNTEELVKRLQPFTKKPVFSVSIPLKLDNCYYTQLSCENSYLEIVEHLVKKHNRKRIAFASFFRYCDGN